MMMEAAPHISYSFREIFHQIYEEPIDEASSFLFINLIVKEKDIIFFIRFEYKLLLKLNRLVLYFLVQSDAILFRAIDLQKKFLLSLIGLKIGFRSTI